MDFDTLARRTVILARNQIIFFRCRLQRTGEDAVAPGGVRRDRTARVWE